MQRAAIENDDVAKIMNSLELQARAFAVRDRQVVIAQRAAVNEAEMKQKWHEAELEDLKKLKEEEDLKIQAQLRERERLKEAFDLELKRKEQNKLLE